MYRISTYLLNKFDEFTVVQMEYSTVVITNNALINFLVSLEESKKNIISYDEIKVEFGQLSDSVIVFLEENKIISLMKEPVLKFEECYLIHNNNKFSEFFVDCNDNQITNLTTLNFIENPEKLETLNTQSLCILYFNPFSLEQYINLVQRLMDRGVTTKVIFYYNHSIYVSNYHNKSWLNPCPKCFFYNLETRLGWHNNHGQPSFQTIIDMIYSKEARFEIAAPIKNYSLMMPIYQIINEATFNSDPNKFINDVYEYKMVDLSHKHDYAYHWELCDCYV